MVVCVAAAADVSTARMSSPSSQEPSTVLPIRAKISPVSFSAAVESARGPAKERAAADTST